MLDFPLNLTGFLTHGSVPAILAYNVAIIKLVEILAIPGSTKSLKVKSQDSQTIIKVFFTITIFFLIVAG